jgi:hypothetical protein
LTCLQHVLPFKDSSDAGAKLLRALGVKGDEPELLNASKEFSGHCLALTLLGSYLADAYNGDIRCRGEVPGHLAHDIRQGARAQKVMEFYQAWFGEGPELSVLRILGLFDRPVDEKTLGVLLKPPAIPGLTQSLSDLSPTEWRMILAKLRRTRLLAGQDPDNPGYLDTHPLVREYFGEQLRNQQANAWKECNRRLYEYYRAIAPELPTSFKEMEPLFLAVVCGCHAGLFRQALYQVYIPRIQRVYSAGLCRLQGVLLLAIGADETQIEASFCEAIRIAKEQKSVWLEKRAEATCAEYHRQKAIASGGRGFRLSLW